ncbi:MAG: hypothetical protein I8H91_12245 [Burkholderiales bacterium]|nr:hypothetical protein [Burkholderiales bacterium]
MCRFMWAAPVRGGNGAVILHCYGSVGTLAIQPLQVGMNKTLLHHQARLHDSPPVAEIQAPRPMRDAAIALIIQGHTTFKLPAAAQSLFWDICDMYPAIPDKTRQMFSFPECTDGFMLQGMEYAKYTGDVDLCDRYCYWHKNRSLHANHVFSESHLYQSTSLYEQHVHAIADGILREIWQFFHAEEEINVRDSSYFQYCAYGNHQQIVDRYYLQGKHEDGHLITLIKPTRDGLVIFPRGEETPVHLHDDEIIIIIITGSLLTALSDGQIPPMYHAVQNSYMKIGRASLVYFVIPNLERPYRTLLGKKQVDLLKIANESHMAFGNTALA